MITPELVSYIKEQLANGKSKDQIRFALLQAGGWKYSDIDEAFSSIGRTKVFTAGRSRSPLFVISLFFIALIAVGFFAYQRLGINSYDSAKEFIFGQSSTIAQPKDGNTSIDCRGDIQCIYMAMNNGCQAAHATIDIVIPNTTIVAQPPIAVTTTKSTVDVSSTSSTLCTVHQSLIGVGNTVNQNSYISFVQQHPEQKAAADAGISDELTKAKYFVGKDATCQLNAQTLQTGIANVQRGAYVNQCTAEGCPGYEAFANSCTGPLYHPDVSDFMSYLQNGQ